MSARSVILAAVLVAAARGAAAQTADSAAGPAVQTWGDSVVLTPVGIALRLPADGVQWVLQANRKAFVGNVHGTHPVHLGVWEYARARTCADWVAIQRGDMETQRRLGMRVPREETLTSPPWLPQGDGWSTLVWMGNACRDGVRDALVVTVDDASDLRDRRAVEATRTMLWYLGAAAARAQR